MRRGWGCVGLYPVVCFNQHHDLSHEESVSTVSIDTVFFVGLRRAKQADVENLSQIYWAWNPALMMMMT